LQVAITYFLAPQLNYVPSVTELFSQNNGAYASLTMQQAVSRAFLLMNSLSDKIQMFRQIFNLKGEVEKEQR